MVRSVVSKVMWVGRATVFLVGLAVILALLIGVATAAFGANGDNFILGVLTNKATDTTRLNGNVAGGPALQIVNTKTNAGSKALDLTVAQNKPPLAVNATAGKATNLNADKLDGKDSTDFVPSLWAKVKDDGTLLAGKGVTKVIVGGGGYFVRFNRDITKCAYIATVGQENLPYADPNEIQAAHSTGAGNPVRDVFVSISDSGTGAVSRGFSLVVVC